MNISYFGNIIINQKCDDMHLLPLIDSIYVSLKKIAKKQILKILKILKIKSQTKSYSKQEFEEYKTLEK